MRAGVRSGVVEVEFDGLVVGCGTDGRVSWVDVLDPDDGPPRPALELRVRLGIAAAVLALVAAEWLGYDGAAFLAGIVGACVVGFTFMRLRDERHVRRLGAADAPAAADDHALLRRREQVKGTDHVVGRRRLRDGHRLLWDFAGEADPGRADELRARYRALVDGGSAGSPSAR